MTRLLALISIMLGIFGVQPTSTTPSQKDAIKKNTKVDRFPTQPISRTTTFAPSKDETRLDALLGTKSVQKEIKLTQKQARNLDVLINSQFARHLPLLMEYRNSTGDPKKQAEVGAQLDDLFAIFSREIKAQLSKDQVRRLNQISAQHAGIAALLLPEMADALNLSPDRQAAIKDILDVGNAKERQMEVDLKEADIQKFGEFPGRNWEEFRKSKPYLIRHDQSQRARQTNHAEAHREVFRLLTKKQKQKFEELLGTPFDPEKLKKPEDEAQKDVREAKDQ